MKGLQDFTTQELSDAYDSVWKGSGEPDMIFVFGPESLIALGLDPNDFYEDESE